MSPNNSTKGPVDDLTAIKGIGEATERWFRTSFKVRTFADLAALPAEKIESRMQRSGKPISRSKIQDWLVQAHEMAGDMEIATDTAEHSDNQTSDRASRSSAESSAWNPFASFVVEFQSTDEVNEDGSNQRTMVHHVEVDKTEEWMGIDVDSMRSWILQRLGDVTNEEPEQSTEPMMQSEQETVTAEETAPSPTKPLSVKIDVTQIRVFQPPDTELPQVIGSAGRAGAGLIKSGEPVSLELSFELAGPAAAELAKNRTRFHAEVYAHNRSTSTDNRVPVSEPDTMEADKYTYTTVLPETTFERGAYRLDCLARLDGSPPYQGYLTVPVLQVV